MGPEIFEHMFCFEDGIDFDGTRNKGPRKTNETHQHCSQPHEIVPRGIYDSGAYLAECGALLQPFRNQATYILEI